ncbi:MAG: hypothetical protein EZS28_007171 [Streblomastix strix]|uniref:Uncharacterized protein n=1 Tax=Streblomastix strix TaxID=222440 RepID=A0A5J4WRV6_9EUKA|nr:MAG: hypothetical protein EZS28_007171 [Streblomastix strix]
MDSKAVARDGLQVNLKSETPQLHFPIHLIRRCLQKIIQQEVNKATIITPDRRAQFWKPMLDRMIIKKIEVGQSQETLHAGKHIKKKGWLLPPRRIIASLKPNLANRVNLAACLSSIIAFTNLRPSELYEANIDLLSNTNLKLPTMIWKGAKEKSQYNTYIRQLLRDAGIKDYIRISQIRAAALTKFLQSGHSKEKTDRWP